MSRPRRLAQIYTSPPIYFITACTFERRELLANHTTHEALRGFAEQSPGSGAWVGRYVLMPDHIHIFAGFAPEGMNLSGWVRSLKGVLSRTLRQAGVPAPHWQKGFFDHLLRSEESYEQKWIYVRENPVRAGLVGRWSQWPYQGEVSPLSFPHR